MAFLTAGTPVSVEMFNNKVLQLGLGDTTTPGHEEIRLVNENGVYYLKIYNSTNLTWLYCQIPQGSGSGLNADLYRSKIIQTGRSTITNAGTTVYFTEQFATTPILAVMAETNCIVYSNNRSKTSVTFYSSTSSTLMQWIAIG